MDKNLFMVGSWSYQTWRPQSVSKQILVIWNIKYYRISINAKKSDFKAKCYFKTNRVNQVKAKIFVLLKD